MLVMFFVCGPLYAGSGSAIIEGKTSSGRTSVKISVQDIVGTFEHVELTIDGKSYKITNNGAKETVIQDKENKVYFLTLESEDRIFRMWMVPGSEKVVSQSDGSYKSTFAAVIEASDPRKEGKWDFAPRITIGCTLDYSI